MRHPQNLLDRFLESADLAKSFALILILFPMLFISCAGPATPFGALNVFSKSGIEKRRDPIPDKMRLPSSYKNYTGSMVKDSLRPRLRFFPEQQILHDSFKLSIVIENLRRDFTLNDLQLRYNNLDVTDSLLEQASVERRPGRVLLEFDELRLHPELGQEIEVFVFAKEKGLLSAARYEEPYCDPFKEDRFGRIGKFKADPKLLSLIKNVSLDYSFNPNMLTGLIAQESGFDSSAISWAKAVGLTQVTPLADQTIFRDSRSWPRNRSISSYPYPVVKSMILSGRLNAEEDWRLDPFYSVKGGALYLSWVRDYWDIENNRKLREYHLGRELSSTGQVLLASYNSGPARVKAAIRNHGENWLQSPTLNAAREYVAKITSYCNHFRH